MQDFQIEADDFFTHKSFENNFPHRHDIGLIKLPKEAELNKLVQPSCWLHQRHFVDSGVVVGWGKISPDQEEVNPDGLYSNKQFKQKVNKKEIVLTHYSDFNILG